MLFIEEAAAYMVSCFLSEGIFVLQLDGEININSITDMRQKVESYRIEQYKKFMIDLQKMSFLDSSGLGYLLILIKQVKDSKGEIVFCAPQKLVKRLLSTKRIDKYVNIFETPEEAMVYLKELDIPAFI